METIILENEHLQAVVKTNGAELCSLIKKSSGVQHIWQANKDFWGWHAPFLFPVVGQCHNDTLIVNNKKYTMPKHGFARKSLFWAKQISATEAVFTLRHSPETLKIYPFEFELNICYSLIDNKLVHKLNVVNLSSNELLPYGIGGHTAFAVPFKDGELYSDYFVKFDADTELDRFLINADGVFNNQIKKTELSQQCLALEPNMFAQDAFIFKQLKSRRVELASGNNNSKIIFTFEGFNYLGLWAKVNAPYICIEPWCGCADTENNYPEAHEREGVELLLPSQQKQYTYSIEVV